MSTVAVVVIVGPAVPERDARATAESIAREAPGAPVRVVGDPQRVPVVPDLGPVSSGDPDLAAAGERLAFIRLGDRWRPGTLDPRLRVLAARPELALGVAGHAIVDAGGRTVRTALAPTLPLDPAHLLMRSTIEASAVVARAERLPPRALELLALPSGDQVVWSVAVHDSGFVPSGEVAADVRLDPHRHGHDPVARATALFSAAVTAVEGPGVRMLRRDLLRRLYLDPHPDAAIVDLGELLDGSAARAVAVVEDLQWALDRQREAQWAERVTWPRGEVAVEDSVARFGDAEVADLRGAVMTVTEEAVLRLDTIRRLQADLQREQTENATLRAELAAREVGA